MQSKLCLTTLLVFAAGCSGTRKVARPVTAAGYERASLRDVTALGRRDANVEVDGVLGPLVAQEVCGGLITFSLLHPSESIFSFLPQWSGPSGVTISLPRARYEEVRALKTFDKVRVRGYLSAWFADGCAWFTQDAGRFLWVDTIEPSEAR